MKPSPELSQQIEKYLNHTIIVEGKNDALALKSFGFKKIFILHKINSSVNNSIEKILLQIPKKEIVCILTDSDKKGKQLFSQVKKVLQVNGIKVDSALRKLIAKEGISHIEGLDKFLENQNNEK